MAAHPVIAALVVLLGACGAPPGRAPEPTRVASFDQGTDDEADATSPPATTIAPAPAYDPPEVPPDVDAIPADAEVTASGLASRIVRPGHGSETPGPTDRVEVHYAGWTTDGELFDSSWQRGEPARFGLDRVIAGWTEGVQLMVAGEVRRLWIPENLAYAGRPGAPQGMLVFDVELIGIEGSPTTPQTPSDVAGPPAGADRSRTGLAWRVLRPGSGARRPTLSDTVVVHYTGWTTDGAMFDSSISHGNPATFRVDRVIAGWTEGLQLMVVGEKRRFWIPADLAYGNNPRAGRPAGMLVFDVELLEIR